MSKNTGSPAKASQATAKAKKSTVNNNSGVTTAKKAPLLRDLFHDTTQQIHVTILSCTNRGKTQTLTILGTLNGGGNVQDNVTSLYGAVPMKGELWSFSVESFDENNQAGQPVGKKIS